MFDSLLDALKIHGPIGAMFLVMGYVSRAHFREDRARAKKTERRLAELETDRVTTHDLERVFDRIERVSDQMQDNQNVLLAALSRKNDL